MARTFAIGDIHGNRNALQGCLDSITLTQDDTVIFLGDMIDRGADSKGVLDDIMALNEFCNTLTIMGNHEQMMLESVGSAKICEQWLYYGGAETLLSFGLTPDIDGLQQVPLRYMDFMRSGLDFYETEQFIYTHAVPDQQPAIQQQEPYFWRWAMPEHDGRYQHSSGKPVVCGHVSQESGVPWSEKGLIMIDTYIHGGEWLTALDMDSLMAYQASEAGEQRKLPLQLF